MVENEPHALDLRLPIDYRRRIDSAAQRENTDRTTWLLVSIQRALAASERAHQESIDDAAWLAFVAPSDGDSLGHPRVRAERGPQPEPDGHPDTELTCPGCGDTEPPHLGRCDACATGYLHDVNDVIGCCQCGSVMDTGGSDVPIEEALDQAAYEDWRYHGDPRNDDLL